MPSIQTYPLFIESPPSIPIIRNSEPLPALTEPIHEVVKSIVKEPTKSVFKTPKRIPASEPYFTTPYEYTPLKPTIEPTPKPRFTTGGTYTDIPITPISKPKDRPKVLNLLTNRMVYEDGKTYKKFIKL